MRAEGYNDEIIAENWAKNVQWRLEESVFYFIRCWIGADQITLFVPTNIMNVLRNPIHNVIEMYESITGRCRALMFQILIKRGLKTLSQWKWQSVFRKK